MSYVLKFKRIRRVFLLERTVYIIYSYMYIFLFAIRVAKICNIICFAFIQKWILHEYLYNTVLGLGIKGEPVPNMRSEVINGKTLIKVKRNLFMRRILYD